MSEDARMASAVLLATGAYLPGEPIDNETLARVAGPLPEEVLEGIQVKTRHWIADPYTGEQSESNSQMAAKAGGQALERAGVEPGEVDLLVVSTASPEYHLPPSSTLVQEHMGLGKIAAIERKFLVERLPDGLAQLAAHQIEQGYLASTSSSGAEVQGAPPRRGPGAHREGRRATCRAWRSSSQPSRAQFDSLWPLGEGRRVEKLRDALPAGERIDLDVYGGALDGLASPRSSSRPRRPARRSSRPPGSAERSPRTALQEPRAGRGRAGPTSDA